MTIYFGKKNHQVNRKKYLLVKAPKCAVQKHFLNFFWVMSCFSIFLWHLFGKVLSVVRLSSIKGNQMCGWTSALRIIHHFVFDSEPQSVLMILALSCFSCRWRLLAAAEPRRVPGDGHRRGLLPLLSHLLRHV